jgi:hypothetical protein
MGSSRGRKPHVQLVHHSRVDPVLWAKRHHNGSALEQENIFSLSFVKRKTGGPRYSRKVSPVILNRE